MGKIVLSTPHGGPVGKPDWVEKYYEALEKENDDLHELIDRIAFALQDYCYPKKAYGKCIGHACPHQAVCRII